MAQMKKLVKTTVDTDKPVEEIKECVIAISMFHGQGQLEALKEVDLWLGKTIEEAEQKQKEAKKEETEIPPNTKAVECMIV